jgi:hypothetical protein
VISFNIFKYSWYKVENIKSFWVRVQIILKMYVLINYFLKSISKSRPDLEPLLQIFFDLIFDYQKI